MLVRKAEEKDILEIVKMWKEFVNETARMNSGISRKAKSMKKNAPETWRKYITKKIRSKKSLVLVAEDNGKLCGYCLSQIRKNIPVYKAAKYGNISSLYVRKECRNRRLSTKFKDKSMAWLRKNKISFATISVNMENTKAKKIYRKWGFAPVKISMMRKVYTQRH